MKITVDSRVRVTGATPGERAALTALCEHENPRAADLPRLEAELERRRFDRRLMGQVLRLREEPKVLRTWRDEGGALTLARGVWSREEWEPFGLAGSFEDDRSHGHGMLSLSTRWLSPKKKPRDYQEAALTAMLRDEQGLLRQSAGSGKTLTLLTFASRVRLPTLAIVPTQALLEQWVGVAISDFGLRPEDVGVIGGGASTVRPLTIATVDSLASDDCRRARELSRTFGVLLFDEVYSAAAQSRYDVVDCSAARYRFGAGDDERRKDDCEPLTYDLFGEVIAKATRRDMEVAGWVMPVRARLVETGVEPPAWWSKLDPLSRSRRYLDLVRHLEDDTKRAALVAALARVSSEQGQTLVFSHHVDHVDRMLADFVATYPEESAALTGRFLGGKAREKERRETTVGLLEGSCRAAFATYAALGKGINLPGVDRAVLATPIHGNREAVSQVLARLNRTAAGKGAPEAVVLYDEKVFGVSPVRAFMRGKREVVVERPDGVMIDGRDYIAEREERSRGTSAGSFFKDLG